MDFVRDLQDIYRAELIALGYEVAHIVDYHTAGMSYFNVVRRTVRSKPRRVEKAKSFTCDPSVQSGLTALDAKILAGQDINGHHSKRVMDSTYEDGLFNDWGVHHFHLGLSTDAKGFVDRTGPVLFARVEDDVVYMIDVRMHGKGHKPWFEQELVRAIHENWPATLQSYRVHGVLGLRPIPTDEDVEALRGAGITTLLQMPDGTVYAPPGGGQSTARTSIESRRRANRAAETARACQEWVSQHVKVISDGATRAGTPLPAQPVFRLRELSNDRFVAEEIGTGFVFSVPIRAA